MTRKEDPKILQYEAWKDIISSPSWKYFVELIQAHVKYLNKQTILLVRDIKILEGEKVIEAIRFQAKAEDWNKVLSLAKQRLNELGKEE